MAYVKNINGYDIRDAEAQDRIDNLEAYVNEELPKVKARSSLQKTVTPVIIGETSDVAQMAACIKHGNRCYTISANNYDGFGRVECYNTDTNSIIWRKNKLVGHANSACWNDDDDFIYLVPMNTYSDGQETELRSIYRYSNDFESMTPVPISTTNRPYMISYDHVQGVMYCAGYLYDDAEIEVFKFENNAFEYWKNIDVSAIYKRMNNDTVVTMQDMAVNDGMLYISTTNREVLIIDIETGETIDTYYVNYYDSMCKYELGELEGFEFDSDGILYAMNTFYITASYETNTNAVNQLGIYRPSNGIITAINTSSQMQCNALNNFSSFNQIAITAARKNLFYLPMNQIKDPGFLANLKLEVSYVSLDDGSYVFPSLYMRKRCLYLHIKSGASLTIGKWWVYSDSLIIRNDGTFTCGYRGYYASAPFDCSLSTTKLTMLLPGTNTLPEAGTNLIDTAYTRAEVVTGNIANDGTIRVNGREIPKYTLSIGGKIVWTEP
jgi:hypothetical protein